MRRLVQANHHDPDNGVYGDCHRTCIAMLLGMERDDVLHAYGPGVDPLEADRAWERWLAERGFQAVWFAFAGEPDGVRDYMRAVNPGVAYILCGTGYSGVGHSVVISPDGELLDPSPSDTGLRGPAEDGHTHVCIIGRVV